MGDVDLALRDTYCFCFFSFLRYYSIYNIFTRNGCWLAALISGFLYSGNGAFLFLFYISILHVLF